MSMDSCTNLGRLVALCVAWRVSDGGATDGDAAMRAKEAAEFQLPSNDAGDGSARRGAAGCRADGTPLLFLDGKKLYPRQVNSLGWMSAIERGGAEFREQEREEFAWPFRWHARPVPRAPRRAVGHGA